MSSTPKELVDARQSLEAGHILEAYKTAQAFVIDAEEGSDERDEGVQIMSAAASIFITEEVGGE